LTKKSVEWEWSQSCTEAFVKLKLVEASAPSLHHPNFNLPFVLETDASDFVVGAVLSQPVSVDAPNELNPVGFYSLKTLKAEGLCDLVVLNVVRYHGLPDSVVSHRGPQFVSEFWNSILSLFGVRRSLTADAHPADRINQNLLQYLTCYVNYLQDDWSNLLSYAEFAINNVVNSSTGKSPFEINYGFNPRMDYLNTTDGVKS
jgi:hypothetical protein